MSVPMYSSKSSIDEILKNEVKDADFGAKYKRLEAVGSIGFNLCRKQQIECKGNHPLD